MEVMMMSSKERQRKVVFEMVKQGRLRLKQASVQCGLSYRQTLRIYKAYLALGDAGLTHQSRGQRSNRKHPHREEIIALYQSRYEGFGPTLASEYLLEEHEYQVNRETLRKWLLNENLWKRQRKRKPYRQRREAKAQFGEMIQIDGSIHDWFETGTKSCLLNMVDDATGKTLSMLDSGETTRIIFMVLWKWIERYGIPLSFYVDLKSVYISPKPHQFSQLQLACERLGIQVIKAYSPEAKGRVERKHGVYQDRFVKELRLRNIKTIDEGNALLEASFLDKLNRKFEKAPRNSVSAHIAVGNVDLNQILCWKYKRKIQHDWTFSFSNRCFQVKKEFGFCIKPRASIEVRKHLDNTISAWYKDKQLPIVEVQKRLPAEQKIVRLKSPSTKKDAVINKNSYWYRSHYVKFKEESMQDKLKHIAYCPLRKRT